MRIKLIWLLCLIITASFSIQRRSIKSRSNINLSSTINDSKIHKDSAVISLNVQANSTVIIQLEKGKIKAEHTTGRIFTRTIKAQKIKIKVKARKHQNIKSSEYDVKPQTISNFNCFLSYRKLKKKQPVKYRKPVIYLYPEKETDVEVKVEPNGEFEFTYPKYNNGWNVTAFPDGTLKDSVNTYNYLFWDGKIDWSPSKKELTNGSIVSKENTIVFLEKSLSEMGLNTSEKNDFITYWAPVLMKNESNYIHFKLNNECNDIAAMNITPKPDNVLRLYMVFYKIEGNNTIKTTPQNFTPINRTGFTVVEWGGAEIENLKELFMEL